MELTCPIIVKATFQQLHVQENHILCHQKLHQAQLSPSASGQKLYCIGGQGEESYPSTILFTSSIPLNFQFQQPLPFKWAAFGLTKSISYSTTHLQSMSYKECQVLYLHSIPLCVCIYCIIHITASGLKKSGLFWLEKNQRIILLMSLSLWVVYHVRNQNLRAPSTQAKAKR